MPSEARTPRILILAGEASGDHHGARVVEVLKRRRPEVEFVGLGGPELIRLGVDTWAGLDRLAVMGFMEVVKHLGFFRALEKRAVEALDSGAIDLVLAIDYPGFNLRIARKARERGVPVLFYIAPQVWAWKAHRAKQLAEDADRIAVILPFEPPIFEREGADVEFVGHPLVEREPVGDAPERLRAELGIAQDARIVALLPGSRSQELDRHLDPFVEAGGRLRERFPDVVPVLATAPGVDAGRFADTGLVATTETRALLHAADAAIVKSGTSTLEAALAEVPFVMAYRTSWMTWVLAKRLVKVDHIALANLVVGRRVVPELLQGDVTAERLTEAVAPLLSGGEARERMLEGLRDVRRRLGGSGASERVAEITLELLERGEGLLSELKYRAVGTLGVGLVHAIHATCRYTTSGEEHWKPMEARGEPWVWCLWHGTMLAPIWRHRDEGAVALVSEHKDGEYITRVMKRLGYDTARGSSTRGGVKGLRGLLRAARSGRTIAVTPDGPRGPARVMKAGALVAAQRGGLPVVPMGVGLGRAWRFSSWDRFSIAKPFSRVHIAYGPPVHVPRDLDAEGLERASSEVQAALDAVTRSAEAAVASRR